MFSIPIRFPQMAKRIHLGRQQVYYLRVIAVREIAKCTTFVPTSDPRAQSLVRRGLLKWGKAIFRDGSKEIKFTREGRRLESKI